MPLLELPHELLNNIVTKLKPEDRIALISSCQRLLDSQGSHVTFLNLCEHVKKTVFCLRLDEDIPENIPVENLEVGYGPFVLINVTIEGPESSLKLHIFQTDFMTDCENLKGVAASIEDDAVYLQYEEGMPGWLDDSKNLGDKVVVLDWETKCQGRLIRMTGEILRDRFNCPECDGSRYVCPGCGGFSLRWPDLFCGCGWEMPCPCCMGYNMAADAKDAASEEGLW